MTEEMKRALRVRATFYAQRAVIAEPAISDEAVGALARGYYDGLSAAAPETAAERDRLREINRELIEAIEAMITDCAFCAEVVGYDEGSACAEHQAVVGPLARARGEAVETRAESIKRLADALKEATNG